MTDPNRERWFQGALAESRRREAGRGRDNAEGYESGYMDACEKYAPRWVDRKDAEEWVDLGWFRVGAYVSDDGTTRMWAMVPPAYGTPGGEE